MLTVSKISLNNSTWREEEEEEEEWDKGVVGSLEAVLVMF